MILVRLITWPYMRKHAARTLLTCAAISLGVSVFVAMQTANRAVYASFQDTINRIAGATELQITAGESGFDEEVLERVQALAEVRVAAPVIEAVVGTRMPGQGNLLVLGIDMTGDRSLREYDLAAGDEAILDDPLVFLAQPDSIMLSDRFASRNGLGIDARVPLETMDGPRDFTVRGILRSSGLTSAFGGNLAVMDIYAAQHVFGRGRRFDRIDVALTPGTSLHDGRAALETLLGPAFEVQPPSTRGESFQSLLRVYRFALYFSSAFAVVVGMFIIFNAFSIAVTERRGEIGLLRALGATRVRVWTLFVGESLMLALVGTAVGIVVGHAAAGVVARGAARLIQGVYGVTGSDVTIELSARVAGFAAAVGLLTSALAAVLPARSAARVDPVKALQKGRHQVLAEGGSRGRLMAAAVLSALGVIALAGSGSLPVFYAGYVSILIAALLAAPAAALWLTRLIRPLLRWMRPVEGALAADSLMAAPRRTSATVAALMLSLALVIGLAGTARGSQARISDWVATALNPDLFVTSSPTLTGRTYRFPNTMMAELESIDGVDEVQRLRTVRVRMDGEPVLLIAAELSKMSRRSRRQAVEGDIDEMFRRAAAGEGFIASENFARLRGARLGDVIDVPAPNGVVQLPLVGVIQEYSDQNGALFIDRERFVREWHDSTIDLFRVYVSEQARAVDVRNAILDRFSSNRRIFVLSNDEVRSYIMGLTDQWFALTWVQIGIAVAVAVLGIVNSLMVSVSDRRRELGILRALGGFPSQVRWTIWLESIGIAIVSVILGLALGAVHLYCVLEMTSRDFPGLRFDYAYPYAVAAALFPIILVTAVAGAMIPAEAAVRGSLIAALEYE